MQDDDEAVSVELSDDDDGWGPTAEKMQPKVIDEVEMKGDDEAELSGELSEDGWGMDTEVKAEETKEQKSTTGGLSDLFA